jgi:hypothetical protein
MVSSVVEVREDLTPQEMNEVIANWKHHLKEYFGDDLRRVNMVRSKLTRVLKEFNRSQSRWLARLEVEPCDVEFLCSGGRRADFEVWVVDRRTKDWVATISLGYYLERGVAKLLSVSLHSDHYAPTFDEALDIIGLAVKLLHVFSQA